MLPLVSAFHQPCANHRLFSGNKPPWTLPAKAKYGVFDRQRACKFFGVKYTEASSFFPILSILVRFPFPPRVLIPYIRQC